MIRRHLTLSGIVLMVISFSLLSPQISGQANKKMIGKSGKRPNILIIYTDDQGYADLNIYGSKELYTPNLDSLARTGVRFTQFYSAAPICSPSRATLMTGRYPQRAQLPNMASSRKGDAGMPGSQVTMAEFFKKYGYQTYHLGKWHLGYTPATEPNQQGFDYSFGFMGGCLDNYSHFFYWQGPNRHDMWRNGKEVYLQGQYLPDLLVSEADSIFAGQHDQSQPFFMYWAINLPHYPLQPFPKWLDYYKNLPSPRDKYAAYISTLDEEVGKLLTSLKAHGLSDNTIIVFQSDQGFSTEERTFGGGGSAGIYRGSKFSLFEGGIRVPAFISWKDHLAPDQVRGQLVTNTDWFPTLADLCGLPAPDVRIDGKTMADVLKSPQAASPHKDLFFWQSGGSRENPQWAVRDKNWKLMHNPREARKAELTPEGFFLVDLDKDPGEKTNIAAKHPDVVQKLTRLYDQWKETVGQQK